MAILPYLERTVPTGTWTPRAAPQVGDWKDTIDEQDASKAIVIIKIV